MRKAVSFILCLVMGCASTMLPTHAKIAASMAETLETVRVQIEDKRHADLLRALEDDDPAGAVRRTRQRWRPVLVAHEAARRAHAAYEATLQAAIAGDDSADFHAALGRYVMAWGLLADLLDPLGVDLPRAPPEVMPIVEP